MTPTRDDDSEWERCIAALRQFVAARGSAPVPIRAVAGGVPVGAWAAARRTDYWTGALSTVQVAALESVPGWDWSGSAQKRWEAGFALVRRYSDEHGTAMVPADVVLDRFSVGKWARAQHVSHAAGRLPEALTARLEALPGWLWTTVDERWEVGLRTLHDYVAEHGTADVPAGAQLDGYRLGLWVRRHREDHRAGDLSPDQVDALEALPGWRWGGTEQQWDEGIAALRSYVAEHGVASPAQKTVIDGFPLGMWVHHRRQQYRQGVLARDRVQVLEALPGWTWMVAAAAWERGYAKLIRYAAEHGDASPTGAITIDGFRVGEWVQYQRAQYHRGRLASDRIEKLEAIPQWQWRATHSVRRGAARRSLDYH